MRAIVLMIAAIAGAAMASPKFVLAQSIFAERPASDEGPERGIELRGEPSPSKPFTLTLSVPLFWTSSVIAANSDSSGDRPDWRTVPDLTLRFRQQYSWMRFTASTSLVLERYRRETGADLNSLEALAKIEFTDGRSSLFVPYVSYYGTSYYERDFRTLDDRRHDLSIGFTSAIGMRQGRVIPDRDAIAPGDLLFGIDVWAGRRLANQPGVQHVFAGVIGDFGYVLTNDLTLFLSPKFRVRWYDRFDDERRRDIRYGAMAKAVWKPDWLTRALPRSELAFSIEYLRNRSTDRFSEYKVWEIGPTIKLATRF